VFLLSLIKDKIIRVLNNKIKFLVLIFINQGITSGVEEALERTLSKFIIMKKVNISFVGCYLIFCLSNIIYAQDPQYSQFYANPIYLNPAFAGSEICPRITMNYRNQWPGVEGNFKTYSLSYDKLFEEVSGGIGLIATRDNNGEGALTTTTAGLVYAYSANVSKTFSLRAGFQANYFQNSINWDKLTFGDMISPTKGFVYDTEETESMTIKSGVDFSSGILVYSDKFYIGAAIHHLTEPEQFLFGYESRLPRKYTIQAGGNIPIKDFGRNKTSVSPAIVIHQQGNFRQLNLGLYVTYNPLIIGMWYRYKDSMIFLTGIQTKKYRIGYSFDFTISKLGQSSSRGSHEISLALLLPCKTKKINYRIAECPKF
jgi:type IX secretion system PorP/SprF family membrane protein